jgi:Uma2 family endonuclease
MHMVAPAKQWTVDAVRALPDDGRRYELIDANLHVNGVAVPNGDLAALDPAMTPSPAPRHQHRVLALARMLADYVDRERCGLVMISPADLELRTGSIVQPDIFVTRLFDGGPPPEWNVVSTLLLAVEVLSPSTARTDRIRKREYYQRAGVPEYWIVDNDAQVIERWRPGDDRPELLAERIEWRPEGTGSPLIIDLEKLFTR